MMESNAPRALHIASIASHLAHLVATHATRRIRASATSEKLSQATLRNDMLV